MAAGNRRTESGSVPVYRQLDEGHAEQQLDVRAAIGAPVCSGDTRLFQEPIAKLAKRGAGRLEQCGT
jgi:hypothetical protein